MPVRQTTWRTAAVKEGSIEQTVQSGQMHLKALPTSFHLHVVYVIQHAASLESILQMALLFYRS